MKVLMSHEIILGTDIYITPEYDALIQHKTAHFKHKKQFILCRNVRGVVTFVSSCRSEVTLDVFLEPLLSHGTFC